MCFQTRATLIQSLVLFPTQSIHSLMDYTSTELYLIHLLMMLRYQLKSFCMHFVASFSALYIFIVFIQARCCCFAVLLFCYLVQFSIDLMQYLSQNNQFDDACHRLCDRYYFTQIQRMTQKSLAKNCFLPLCPKIYSNNNFRMPLNRLELHKI